MSKGTQTQTQGASILAAVGAKGTEATLTNVTDFAALSAQIGGTVKAIKLDSSVAVYFNIDAQAATLLDPYALQGVLALCGIDGNGNPVSLNAAKQVIKFGKVFRKARNINAEPRREVK